MKKFRFAPSLSLFHKRRRKSIDNSDPRRIINRIRQREDNYLSNRSESHRSVRDGRVDNEIHFTESFLQGCSPRYHLAPLRKRIGFRPLSRTYKIIAVNDLTPALS